MIAKMRMQVGDTVISWGALPESSSVNAYTIERAVRPKFAVIEGGRQSAAIASDQLPLKARSA